MSSPPKIETCQTCDHNAGTKDAPVCERLADLVDAPHAAYIEVQTPRGFYCDFWRATPAKKETDYA